MGPKRKRKISKENINQEQRHERRVVLARERQRRRRARLIGGESEEEERADSASASSLGTFQETPEEISVEVDIKEECCSEEEGETIQEEEPESEILPGPKGQLLYYDGIGYYYTQLYEDVKYRWLQCSHGECKVLAKMSHQDKAPIQLVDQARQHEHPANPVRRDRMLFLHTIKTRHAKESTPFSVIFQQEAYKNPVGASFFSFDKIQAHLQKKISLGGSDNLSQESVLSAASKLSMITIDRPSINKEPTATTIDRPSIDKELVVRTVKTIDRPSIDKEPVVKKMRIDKDPPVLGNTTKKLQLLKSLKDVSVTECETSEPTLVPFSQPSERIPGLHSHSYLYHDGFGYFYKPLAISGNTRYLVCNTFGCHAKAVMTLEENAPISLALYSPAHNHSLLARNEKQIAYPPAIHPVNIMSIQGQEKEKKKVVEEAENQDANRTPMVLNKFTAVPQRKLFEKLEGPEYYYDFKGHYYVTTGFDRTKRFLRCLYPTCMAQAMMHLDDDAAGILPITGSRPHNHKPDYTTKFHNQIKLWEDLWLECLPSERLPSLRLQYCCYHDGKGYYYYQTTQVDNIRYLGCAEPRCPVKAYMNTQKDAPITISGLRMGHSHGPDHTLRDALLFIDAVRVRVRSDTAPASAIALETARNSVGAGRVDLQRLRLCLEQATKLANDKYKDGIVEDEVDFLLCLKPQKSVTLKPSTESQVPVPNHFTSPVPILDDYLNKKEDEKYTKAELIPALLSDSWLYHDGCGYYYNTSSISNGYRYLQCVLPKCGARALVGQAGGPVKLQKPHSHGPQPPQHRFELWFFHRIKIRAQKNPDIPISEIYKEVADKDPEGAALVSQSEIRELMHKYLISVVRTNPGENVPRNRCLVNIPLKAETLPSAVGRCQYHDGQGYYYCTVDNAAKKTFTTHLRCSYRAACTARAILVAGRIKMNGNTRHDHNPDLIHRDVCLFSQALKKRARDEDTPISVIYKEEAEKYPKAAAVLREDRLVGKLTSIRRYVRREINILIEEEESEGSPNCNNQSRPYVSSEVFPGRTKDVYHDGRGYYYHETFTTNQMRYLMCCEPHCLAQAKMGLMAGSPVLGQAGAPCHCHAPDPLRRNFLMLVSNIRRRAAQHNLESDALYNQETAKEPVVAAQIPQIYLFAAIRNARLPNRKGMDLQVQDKNEDDELWAFSESGERLPSEHGWLYHNSRGYLYYSHDVDKSQSRRILKCCEEGCDSTVLLEGDLRLVRAPGSLLHNHLPEPQCRGTLRFLHRVATRAQLEHMSVADIYEEEARRDPDGAALVPKNQLNETLQSLTVRRYFKELEEEELGQKDEFREEAFRDDEVSEEPCEVLPSASSDDPVYHDSEGHYYTGLRNTCDRQFVKCLMPLCNARGYIVSSEPWKLLVPKRWEEHNHKADPLYRDKLLFVNNVRKRSLNENTPIDVIYMEELEKEPFGADQVNEVSMKNLMYKLRKSKSVADNIETFPFEDFTGDSTVAIAEKVSELPVETQNNVDDVGHCENQSDNPFMIQVKVERMEGTEEGENEYTEEEYLEGEGLGEKQIVENGSTKYTNETSMETDEVHLPTEKLPSRTNSSIYHNGKGYYFQANTVKDNIMYMRCIEPRCKMRGMKPAGRDDAPIVPTKKHLIHNHRPDFTRRKHMLFVKRCKERAAAEPNLTINEILESEVARDPETASQFTGHNIKSQMIRYRVQHAANSDLQSTGPRNTREQSLEKGVSFHDASITDPITEKPNVDIHGDAVPEKIPSLVGDTLWYAAGYFYSTYITAGSIERVKCVDKECVARAQVMLGDRGQPLSIRLAKPTAHCHSADLQRKDQMLFIERCKRRARTTLQSVEEIYYDEAAKAPEVAAQLSAVRVKRAMGFAKKERMKKGIQVVPKELKKPAASGDHGMSELGEMAKTQAATPAVTITEQAGASESGAQEDSDYYYPEETLDDTDDLWTVNPNVLSPEEKAKRRKALARERQRRRRTKMVENPEKWEQLEKEKEKSRQRALVYQRQKKVRSMEEKNEEDINSEPKTSPVLGPKFLKELVQTTNEEEFQEEEELVDQTYSDYVTLEEELDSYETGLQNEGEEAGSSVQSAGHEEGACEREERRPKNTEPSHLVHGRRVNSYCYHDGSGFYYDTLKISDNYRYLKCVVVGCQAQGFMPLEQDGAPIILTRESPAHFHPPDPRHKELVRFVKKCETRALKEDIPLQNIYEEEAEADPVSASKLVMENLIQRMTKIRKDSLESRTQSKELSATEDAGGNEENVMSENDEESDHPPAEGNESEKSEVLPGYRPNSTIFHDMKGYYFIFNALKEKKRYLRCIEPLCRVRGSMRLYDGAPIRTSSHSVHNHRPDYQRKNFVLFLQACKERAINEDLPLSQIYREECDKDPVSASMITSQNMLQRMQRARKQIIQYYPTDEDQSEFAEACTSSTVTTDIPPHELVEEEEEDIQAQEEAYEHIVTETVTDDNEPAEEDPESEAIERAISQLTTGESGQCGSKELSSEGGPVAEDQLQPSEVLPGIRPNSTMYHDGRGYYYIFNNHSENVWYLRCLEPHCRVRAHMEPVEGSPIIQSPNTLHNHRPDFKRKQFVLWMEQAKHRAVTEDLPIPIICAQEAARDPQSANMIPQENMKTRLYRARKALGNKDSSELEAAGEEDNEAAGNKDTEVMVADSEYDQDQDSDAVFTIQAEGSQDSNTVYLYQSDNSPQQRPTYVDDKGFCYEQTTVRYRMRYLKCVEAECKARASMGLEEDSAITLSKQGSHHNHAAEQSQLAMLLDQSDSDSAAIQVIYTDEDGGHQLALCHVVDDQDRPKRPYRHRHKPELTIDPEEPPVDPSALCEVDVAGEDVAEGDYYHNEDQQKYPLKPSEVIPGLRPDANNYHDGNGFYYELNRLSPNIRYLKCLIKDCKARAYMELGKDNAPIVQTNFARHNHGPDLSRKQFTVFLHRVTRRAAEEDTPIHVIYQQEAERDPQSASQIRMENVKQRMMRFRKKHRQDKVMNQDASSAAELDVDGSIYHFFIGDEKPELIHGDEVGRGKEEEMEEVKEEEEGEGEGDGVLYESYVVSEVEVESQQQQD